MRFKIVFLANITVSDRAIAKCTFPVQNKYCFTRAWRHSKRILSLTSRPYFVGYSTRKIFTNE